MDVRMAVAAVLAATATAFLVTVPTPERGQQPSAPPPPSSASPQPAPPRMFSPQYAESLHGILELEEADAARLEQRLASNPSDYAARLQLMAYYKRGDHAVREEARAKRVQHALWLIEHHPDSEILHSYVALFPEQEIRPEELRRAAALWEAATRSRPADATIQWNAASFFAGLDPGLHLRYLEATAAADPNHPFALTPKRLTQTVSPLTANLYWEENNVKNALVTQF